MGCFWYLWAIEKQQATAYFRGGEVQMALSLCIEENVQVCYAPELDLYGYGTGEIEALASFAVVPDNCPGYVMAHNTLDTNLKALGGRVNTRTRTQKYTGIEPGRLFLDCLMMLHNVQKNNRWKT